MSSLFDKEDNNEKSNNANNKENNSFKKNENFDENETSNYETSAESSNDKFNEEVNSQFEEKTKEDKNKNFEKPCGAVTHECCSLSLLYNSLSIKMEKLVQNNTSLTRALNESREVSEKRFITQKMYNVRQCVNTLLSIEDIVTSLLSMIETGSNSTHMSVYDLSVLNSIRVLEEHINLLLNKFEVDVINPEIGEHLNPNLHMVISTVPSEQQSDINNIVKILRKGYKIGDSIIRPAVVIVFV